MRRPAHFRPQVSDLLVSLSNGGALSRRPATQIGFQYRRRTVGGLIQPDVRSRRDDLIDPVQNVVAETNLGTGEQIVEMLHRARAIMLI
jgi:hypothetical protein